MKCEVIHLDEFRINQFYFSFPSNALVVRFYTAGEGSAGYYVIYHDPVGRMQAMFCYIFGTVSTGYKEASTHGSVLPSDIDTQKLDA
jgi:hypothetical protein